MLGYPENWTELAATVKQSAGYRCNRCGLKCLPPNSYRHLDLSLRRKLSAQVHHLDGNPAQNDRSNLVCLCSGCHLIMHRHRPQPTPGQLSLKLKLPKVRRSSQNKQNWQLTLADLIDRLPRLSVELHQQLELDLDNYPEELALLSPAMVQGKTAPNWAARTGRIITRKFGRPGINHSEYSKNSKLVI